MTDRIRVYEGPDLVYDSETSDQGVEEFLVAHGGGRLRVHIEGTVGAESLPDFPIHEKVEE